MKAPLGIIAIMAASLIALTGCFESRSHASPPTAKPLTTEDIAVGMTTRAFASIFPGAKIPVSGQWIRPDEIHGLRGEWTYSFDAKKLSWFVFNSYEATVNANTFRQYLDATRLTIAGYTTRYGNPSQTVRGVLEFKDPKRGYPGYPVLKSSWNTGTQEIRVDYSVLGNNREKAQLLFAVEVRK